MELHYTYGMIVYCWEGFVEIRCSWGLGCIYRSVYQWPNWKSPKAMGGINVTENKFKSCSSTGKYTFKTTVSSLAWILDLKIQLLRIPNFYCLLCSKWKTENVKFQVMIHRQNVGLQITLWPGHTSSNLLPYTTFVIQYPPATLVTVWGQKLAAILEMYQECIWTHRHKWFFLKDLPSQESFK